jgi:hypothetical protein
MKAFLAAICAMVVISVAAAYGLDSLGHSSAAVYQSDSVRLDD